MRAEQETDATGVVSPAAETPQTDHVRHTGQSPPGETSARADGMPDLSLVADSLDEDHAVARGQSRQAQGTARALRARATSAREDAQRARDLAVSALAEADGLRRAMQSRSDIDMAKGILMERLRISPQEAFDMLVAHSQTHHVKLIDVARAIVATTADGLD